jgi:hypothetical protein
MTESLAEFVARHGVDFDVNPLLDELELIALAWCESPADRERGLDLARWLIRVAPERF